MAKNTMMVYGLSLVLLLALVYYLYPSLFNFMKLSQGFAGDDDEDEGFAPDDEDELEGFDDEEEDDL